MDAGANAPGDPARGAAALPVAVVDAFTTVPGEGNRAGVVLDASRLDPGAMQSAARAIAASETAFLVSRDGAPGWRLRYFTPTTEVPFCGHATVAMLHRLAESGRIPGGRVTVACAAGRLDAEIEPVGRGRRIWLATPLHPWTASPVGDRALFELLGGDPEMRDPTLPLQRSGPKLFVPVRLRRDLFALQPRWDRLAALDAEHGISGVFAFTRDTIERSSIAHGRCFAPARGVREDPVTGSANGPLAEYLAANGALPLPGGDGRIRTRSEQGDAMGRPGRVELEVEVVSGKIAGVRVGGVAVTVLAGALCGALVPARGGASVP